MSKAAQLTQEQRENLLKKHPLWSPIEDRDALKRSFSFKTFSEAWSFMTRVALFAEKLNHHPEWSNTYNQVEITMTTHSCNGLSELDAKMVNFIDRLVGN